ncbi:MAG: hypothetical protein JWR02_307 [Mucilaginibacter sp.]|nr:hypothetical protein [Mucilaginibacter sp.]
MAIKVAGKRLEPGPVQIILLLALLQVFVTLLTDGFCLSFDEAIWHYIGRNWFRHNLIPYSGGTDNKSPLMFAVFGLSDALFGVNYWFPRILGTIFQSVGIYYVYKVAKHVSGERAGKIAILFYGLSLIWHGTGGRYVSYTETYEIMFVIIAFYLCITAKDKKGFFMSGIVAALGLGFRLSAIFGIVTILVASFYKNKMSALAFCGGVCLAILFLLMIAGFAGIGFHDLFTYGLADNFGPGSTTDHTLMWKLENFSDKFFYTELILFYPLALVYFFIKRKVDLFVLWLVMEFIGIAILGKYTNVHLKEMLPPLSIINAFAVAHLINVYKIPVKHTVVIILIMFFPKLLEPIVNLKKLLFKQPENITTACMEPYPLPDEGSRKQLGLWIKDNTLAGEKVFVAGYGAQVQAYSERLSPTIYFNVTQTDMARRVFFKELSQNKPEMILVPLFPDYKQNVSLDLRQFVDTLVTHNYYFFSCRNSYNIYKIKTR